jgi:hypothetical protein
LGGLLLRLTVITINPALLTSDNPGQERYIIGGDLTKFLAHVDTLLLLISCQNPGHKFGGDTMHAQFSSQNPLACPITNSDLISKVLNGSMLILTNGLLKFGKSVGHCAVDGPTCVLVILNGCPTGPEPSMPFKHLCTANAFFPERMSNHCQGIRHTFSEICIKFDAHSLSLCQLHRETASGQINNSKKGRKKSARPPGCMKFCTLPPKIC